MSWLPLFLVSSFSVVLLVNCQYAPGVNPNQYQGQQQQQYQPPPPPQYQQPPQQQPQYQQQQQYQNQPQQQQQQQQQPYQPPPPSNPQGGHQHAAPLNHQRAAPQNQRVLHANNIKEERDHIKEHMEVPIDTTGMSEQELQYHYFKMHDADSNNKLDGQELIKSLFHWHDESNHDPEKSGHPTPDPKIFTDDDLVQMIDPILDQDDRNKDGFIDYPEFVQAQRSAANAATANTANANANAV